jgi:hypothetical protein
MGDRVPVERVRKAEWMVSEAEVSIGVVDLKSTGDHAHEKDRVEPMSEAYDAGVAPDQRTLL